MRFKEYYELFLHSSESGALCLIESTWLSDCGILKVEWEAEP